MEELVVLAHDPNCPRWNGELAPDFLLVAIHRRTCERCRLFAVAARGIRAGSHGAVKVTGLTT